MDAPHSPPPPNVSATQPSRRRRRWPWLLGGVLGLLLALVGGGLALQWFGADWIVGQVAEEIETTYGGTLTWEGASLNLWRGSGHLERFTLIAQSAGQELSLSGEELWINVQLRSLLGTRPVVQRVRVERATILMEASLKKAAKRFWDKLKLRRKKKRAPAPAEEPPPAEEGAAGSEETMELVIQRLELGEVAMRVERKGQPISRAEARAVVLTNVTSASTRDLIRQIARQQFQMEMGGLLSGG